MTAAKKLEIIQKQLEEHNQGHLLALWDQLDLNQRKNLLEQISRLDLNQIDRWIAKDVKNDAYKPLPANFAPAEAYEPAPSNDRQREKYNRAKKLGKEHIAAGKVAAFVVAGGQGTRLGFDGPKGNFPISPVKKKTLFRLFAEYVTAAAKRYNTTLAWYIMTSPSNHTDICDIFRSNDFYGLKAENVFIFQQGTLPDFDFQGRILLADKDTISCSPDGHGGSLKALYRSGALEDMKKRGVEFISYFQVDNPLINIFDPLFIGLHALDKAQMSSRAVLKTGPEEKVGVFCMVDGRVTVVEYSDLSEKQAGQQNPDGSLVFSLGSIAVHIINTDFVESLNKTGLSLPMHKAVKKIPYIDRQGRRVQPAQPNGIKLEHFVFDALPLASKSIILLTERDQQFAPVKNATGKDSPEAVRKLMIARAVDWLESAGVALPKKADGSPDAVIEIAPGFALYKEDIKKKSDCLGQIKPGASIYLA